MSAGLRRLLAATAAVLAAGAIAPLARAASSAASDAAIIRRGITHATQAGWLKPADAYRYRVDVTRALRDISALPTLRAQLIASQLGQLTPLWDSYTSPRALALFTQLEQNLSYLETHRVPSGRVDVAGPDGVVYRYFWGLGLEFHPLASFSALLNDAAAKNVDATRTLAAALLARAVPRGPRLIWEYSFPYGGGRPPWASGLAEALAAQALARAGSLLDDPSLETAAARAYAAATGLLLPLPSGSWIRLYGFDREIVLNAQLQAILSFLEYGRTAADAHATALAQVMSAAAQALFGRFDTGDWSLYELGGAYAPLDYEVYVTQLLGKLATQTQDPFWTAAAQRFQNYLYSPAQVTEGTPPPTIYPQPQDGWLDSASIPITLSQRASLTVAIAGQLTTYRFGPGAHVLAWTPAPALPPGTYPVQVSTLTYAGNRKTYTLTPITVAWDTAPPPAASPPQIQGSTLSWQFNDAGTPWLELKLDLADPSGASPPQTFDLGYQPTSGSLQLTLPPGTWQATLEATNSAGLTSTTPLQGSVSG
jgi:hypothetical protein